MGMLVILRLCVATKGYVGLCRAMCGYVVW